MFHVFGTGDKSHMGVAPLMQNQQTHPSRVRIRIDTCRLFLAAQWVLALFRATKWCHVSPMATWLLNYIVRALQSR